MASDKVELLIELGLSPDAESALNDIQDYSEEQIVSLRQMSEMTKKMAEIRRVEAALQSKQEQVEKKILKEKEKILKSKARKEKKLFEQIEEASLKARINGIKDGEKERLLLYKASQIKMTEEQKKSAAALGSAMKKAGKMKMAAAAASVAAQVVAGVATLALSVATSLFGLVLGAYKGSIEGYKHRREIESMVMATQAEFIRANFSSMEEGVRSISRGIIQAERMAVQKYGADTEDAKNMTRQFLEFGVKDFESAMRTVMTIKIATMARGQNQAIAQWAKMVQGEGVQFRTGQLARRTGEGETIEEFNRRIQAMFAFDPEVMGIDYVTRFIHTIRNFFQDLMESIVKPINDALDPALQYLQTNQNQIVSGILGMTATMLETLGVFGSLAENLRNQQGFVGKSVADSGGEDPAFAKVASLRANLAKMKKTRQRISGTGLPSELRYLDQEIYRMSTQLENAQERMELAQQKRMQDRMFERKAKFESAFKEKYGDGERLLGLTADELRARREGAKGAELAAINELSKHRGIFYEDETLPGRFKELNQTVKELTENMQALYLKISDWLYIHSPKKAGEWWADTLSGGNVSLEEINRREKAWKEHYGAAWGISKLERESERRRTDQLWRKKETRSPADMSPNVLNPYYGQNISYRDYASEAAAEKSKGTMPYGVGYIETQSPVGPHPHYKHPNRKAPELYSRVEGLTISLEKDTPRQLIDPNAWRN